MINITLYFIYLDVPPIWNVLLRTLVGAIMLVLLLIFFVGYRQILKQFDEKWVLVTSIILLKNKTK
jgi:hypothetical protein